MQDLQIESVQFLKHRKDLHNIDIQNQWKLLLTQTEIRQSVQYCARQINRLFEGQEIIITCILKGSVYFFVDLTRELTIPYSTYFIEASSYHSSQTQSETVELLSVINPKKFLNKKVILIDELFDNGSTLYNVKKCLIEKGIHPHSIFTCTLFKKHKEDVNSNNYEPPNLFGLIVPNVWLVGYGLDDNHEKRGWNCLYACPKIEGIPKVEDDLLFENPQVYQMHRHKLLQQLSEKSL